MTPVVSQVNGTTPLIANALNGAPLELPLWSAIPFVLLLAAIAILPLFAESFWQLNRNKTIVSAFLALPVAGYLIYLGPATRQASTGALLHELNQYASFIILLASLYCISGGIAVRGDLRHGPGVNAAFLGVGIVLANVIGTTGASMLLIRPFLRLNRNRAYARHVPIFFIFLVSNLAGCLTPLGDPPLFLGFLNGVDFFWTLSLFPHWLFTNGLVLLIFYVWDRLAYHREAPGTWDRPEGGRESLWIVGTVNLPLLLGVVLAVLLQSEQVGAWPRKLLDGRITVPDLTLTQPWGEILMVAMGLLSWALTPKGVREENEFHWGAMLEVTVLFLGIFVTMVPALALLHLHGAQWNITHPWEFFWLTGALSSFLDNAPTYMAFATLAASPQDLAALAETRPDLLRAVSCGAVFMGANTYIGNGPNFMVKAIADHFGFHTPSFLGYLAYSTGILLPVFLLVTLVFFRS